MKTTESGAGSEHHRAVGGGPVGWLHTYKKTGESSLATYPIDMNIAYNKERWECVALYAARQPVVVEPVGYWFTDDPAKFAMPGSGFRPGAEPPVDAINVVPAYAAPPAPEMSPEFTDTARAAIAWVLWHHQGGSSAIGQPLRYALGMGDHEELSAQQISEAKRYAALVGARTDDFKHPAPAAVPVDQFRDADHLAEWLGSLVAACGQEEWDAAQAAMNGIRAFQNHPDAVERLRAAIEGECDGLAISGQQASAILAHVMLPEPDGFFATHPQPAAADRGDA
ncbi:hypothetical protein Murka_0059 [Xanthomonas phage Murka]|nr:hypothetical protein Murka_0059 [Xanthomonas phage Murka]